MDVTCRVLLHGYGMSSCFAREWYDVMRSIEFGCGCMLCCVLSSFGMLYCMRVCCFG